MSSLEAVDKKALEIKDGSEQVWIYVQDAVGLICKENPKLHNLGDLITSIKRYGFQEVAKYDATLGAVKAGNGRIEALALMERDGYDVPRGIGVEKDSGSWAMPMTVGTDAKSRSEALAYLTDSNNLVMAGGDLTAFEMMRVWDTEYVDLLTGLGELPVSVDGDTLDALVSMEDIEAFTRPDFDALIEEFEEPETGKTIKDEKWFYVEFYEDEERWAEMCELLEAHRKGQSIHELDADYFYGMVKNAADGE